MEKFEVDSIDSHAELVKVLPELKLGSGGDISRVFDGRGENGKLKTREAIVGVTLRHLLEHTSGLGYKSFDPTLAKYVGILSEVIRHGLC